MEHVYRDEKGHWFIKRNNEFYPIEDPDETKNNKIIVSEIIKKNHKRTNEIKCPLHYPNYH
tara:strand:+ start:465 stop:647 length:183 start_codon:yes stop_codon:yes gene_type:complete